MNNNQNEEKVTYWVTIGTNESEEVEFDNFDDAWHLASYVLGMGGYATLSDTSGITYDVYF